MNRAFLEAAGGVALAVACLAAARLLAGIALGGAVEARAAPVLLVGGFVLLGATLVALRRFAHRKPGGWLGTPPESTGDSGAKQEAP